MFKDILSETLNSDKTCHADFLNQAVGDMDNEEFLTKNFMFNVMFVGIFAGTESISTMLALIFKFLFETPRGSRGINGNKIYMISKNIVLHHIVKPYSTMATSLLHAKHTVILERREGQSTALCWDECNYKSMALSIQVTQNPFIGVLFLCLLCFKEESFSNK